MNIRTARAPFATATLALALLALAACGQFGKAEPQTPEEFVAQYAEAYREGDVETIVRMTAPLKGESDTLCRSSVESDIKSRGFGYTAWSHTRFVSATDRGSYYRVEVNVDVAPSTIVLLKSEGHLRISQEPSSYESE